MIYIYIYIYLYLVIINCETQLLSAIYGNKRMSLLGHSGHFRLSPLIV